ncbi:MAG TPA: phosphomevalonate kinase [Bacilli bacterium]
MTWDCLQIKAPGKLFIAGEYAVLEPYQSSVVIAVDRYILAKIEKNEENSIALPDLGVGQTAWRYADGTAVFSPSDERFRFVGSAIETSLRYLQEHQINLKTFRLTITSELDDPSGRKYGLGSSAAVVVAVVSAILHFHGSAVKLSRSLLFKLAAIAHLRAQGNGSGADVAAAVFGGWIKYASFQADWLLRRIRQTEHLTTIIDEPWPFLAVDELYPIPDLHVCVGWTGQPASTSGLIKQVQAIRETSPEMYQEFLQSSMTAVKELTAAFAKSEVAPALAGIARNRAALKKLGDLAQAMIETPELTELCRLAEKYNGAGKPSGAGGGDCGIALIAGEANAERLRAAWRQAGITPLRLNVDFQGVAVSEQSAFGMKLV